MGQVFLPFFLEALCFVDWTFFNVLQVCVRPKSSAKSFWLLGPLSLFFISFKADFVHIFFLFFFFFEAFLTPPPPHLSR